MNFYTVQESEVNVAREQWTSAPYSWPLEGSALMENKLDCFEHK